ncbi:hypothetical protein [Magnetofaba australis]|uniref:Uncharacterized protein n=1 Tax=Magnetofaba australis IT-1 TaxID=1434232 RepID=A0A1Y2K506_9PROT|nr:hypothetical protein [Magnetofaba australis]OSM04447.1 hypothetical protein MAIT1_04359 [Magnetofaba australis IT-1]
MSEPIQPVSEAVTRASAYAEHAYAEITRASGKRTAPQDRAAETGKSAWSAEAGVVLLSRAAQTLKGLIAQGRSLGEAALKSAHALYDFAGRLRTRAPEQKPTPAPATRGRTASSTGPWAPEAYRVKLSPSAKLALGVMDHMQADSDAQAAFLRKVARAEQAGRYADGELEQAREAVDYWLTPSQEGGSG